MWFAYLPAYTPAKSHTLHQHVEIAVYNSATENVLRPCNSTADDTEKEDVIHVHLSTPAPVCAVPLLKMDMSGRLGIVVPFTYGSVFSGHAAGVVLLQH